MGALCFATGMATLLSTHDVAALIEASARSKSSASSQTVCCAGRVAETNLASRVHSGTAVCLE